MQKLADQTKGMQGLYSRKSVLNNMPEGTPEELKEVAKMLQGDNVKGFPMLAYINEYLTIINDEMQLTLTGKETVDEAASRLFNNSKVYARYKRLKDKLIKRAEEAGLNYKLEESHFKMRFFAQFSKAKLG